MIRGFPEPFHFRGSILCRGFVLWLFTQLGVSGHSLNLPLMTPSSRGLWQRIYQKIP